MSNDTSIPLLPSQVKSPNKVQRFGDPDDPGRVPGVEHDRYGRYLLPTPDGDPNETTPWTRVTTLAGAVVSQEGLRVYTERRIARGFGLRSDARDLMAARPDDVATQDDVLAVVKEAAMIGAEARGGTARHFLLEHWTRTGELRVDESERIGRDLLAATRKLLAEGLTPVGVERLVVHESFGYAGRLDLLVSVETAEGTATRILDAKFGKNVIKSPIRHQIGVQLALYANTTHTYDPTTRVFSPMRSIDRSVGYVLHAHDGRAELYEVDLIAGWQSARTAITLHRQRRESVTFVPVGRQVVVEPPGTVESGIGGSPVLWDGVDHSNPNEVQTDGASTPSDESATPESERTPSGRRRKACSRCRQPGHTVRRCPEPAPILDPHRTLSTLVEPTVDNPTPVESDRIVGLTIDDSPSSIPGETVTPGGTRLIDRINACESQEELGRLWREHVVDQGDEDWGDEHTEAARSLMGGLRVIAEMRQELRAPEGGSQ